MRARIVLFVLIAAVVVVVLTLHFRVYYMLDSSKSLSPVSSVNKTSFPLVMSAKLRGISHRRLPDKLMNLLQKRVKYKMSDTNKDWHSCTNFACNLVHLNGSRFSNFDKHQHVDVLCADLLFEMLVSVSRTLLKYGIQSYLTFGSLLGAVNTGDIFPWTQDVDLAINTSSFQSSSIAQIKSELHDKFGLVL